MKAMAVNNLYESFVNMTPSEQQEFMSRIKDYEKKIVAYTTTGQPLNRQQYVERANACIAQCTSGQSKSLELLTEELGYTYAEL